MLSWLFLRSYIISLKSFLITHTYYRTFVFNYKWNHNLNCKYIHSTQKHNYLLYVENYRSCRLTIVKTDYILIISASPCMKNTVA